MAKVYIASSWRNKDYPELVVKVRAAGHELHDWRNPPEGGNGFSWDEIDTNWQNWTADQYRRALGHSVAFKGFNSDLCGMQLADVGILLLPSGRSAHLEIGWMAGAGKYTMVRTQDGQEPELMAKLCDRICISDEEVLATLSKFDMKYARDRRSCK